MRVTPGSAGTGADAIPVARASADAGMVETLFGTSGRFMYFITRYSGPKWEKEQTDENASVAPVTLSTVEGSDTDLDSFLKYERGHGRLLVPDQLLCEWVDSEVVPGLGC